VPTAPGVTSNINDLLSRMGVVESGVNDLDVRVKAIEDTPGVGAFTNLSRGTILGSAEDGKVSANEDGTGSVSGWSDVVKSAQISDMLTKTTAASTYLTKTDAAATYESIEDAAQTESVANDAQTKANGCFNNVTLNAAGDGLTFTTPGDEHTDVTLPGISVIDKAILYTVSGEIRKLSITRNEIYYVVRGLNITEIFGKITRVFSIDINTVSSTVTNIYQPTSDLATSIATALLSELDLIDGTYFISYAITGSTANITGSLLSYSFLKCTISDKEIISVTPQGGFFTSYTSGTSWRVVLLGAVSEE